MQNDTTSHKLVRGYLFSAGVLVIVTGAAKVFSSLGDAKILSIPDPILMVSYRNVFQVVGVLELVVALICIFVTRLELRAGFVAWLATSFGLYRLGLLWIGAHKPCSCLGSLTSKLGIPPETADTGMKFVLGYLLIGSYASLFWLWKQRTRSDGTIPRQQAVSV